MSVFFPALPLNAHIAAVMDNLLAIGLGLAVRYVTDIVSRGDIKTTGTLVGMWEGIVLSHFLKKMPNSTDPLIGYGVRLFFDYFLNESVTRLVLVIVWTGLGIILADITPALWVDVGLHRYWRRFRRDISYMSRSMPQVDIFPRARTVRFSPRHTTAGLSDSESTVTPSIISTTQAPLTAAPRTTSKRHVPGSFESDVDTNTEPGSVPIRQRELPGASPSTAQPRRRQSIYPSFTPATRDNVSDVSSVGHDVDEGNISSPTSEALTEDISLANPNEIPDEPGLEYVDTKFEGTANDGTPKQRNAGLPTPTDSTHPFDPLRQDDESVRLPPSADLWTIPDNDDTGPMDGWGLTGKGDAMMSDTQPPPLPDKDRGHTGQSSLSATQSTASRPASTTQFQEAVEEAANAQQQSNNNTNRSSAMSEKPPSYHEYSNPFDPIFETPLNSGEPEEAANDPASSERQANPESVDGADEMSTLSDLSEATLQTLQSLSSLDQMAKLHQLITKAKEVYQKAARRYESVQTSGNKAMASTAKSEMDERERRLKKLTQKAEACFLTRMSSLTLR